MLARGQFMLIAGNKSRRLIEIPTTYDGPDLAETAERSHLSVEQLIALHAEREYTAYFLGFLPGTAYCGRLDPRIVAPRLERPRERVPAGSVAIADGQTIVYPLASPGGWRLIGRTELAMFDPSADDPVRIRAGDHVSLRSAVIRISDAGVRSTVQDRGRFGHLRSGVPPAGAADPFALAAANALVGNADDAAGIEIIGTTFRFSVRRRARRRGGRT